MRLSAKALAITSALLWGGGILFVGVINLASPSYGADFLTWTSSIYPGFHNSRTFVDVIVGTLYGTFDGACGGFLFALVYNLFAGKSTA
jgi:hypothetical protein